MNHPVRPGLERIAAYRPGRPAPRTAQGDSFKLSANENPFAPLPSVLQAIELAAQDINRYPDMGAQALRTRIAERFDVEADNIVLGAGSVEVAGQVIHAATGPGDEVLFAWRSFEAYPLLSRVAGAEPVMVPLDAEARHDLEAMAEAITERTKVIFICNPNNPTGTTVEAAALDRFLEGVPAGVIVVIDEAYVHFDRATDSPDGMDYFRRHHNVVVLHTFSKAYGLAGLRIGYAIAPTGFADEMRKVSIPFGVTSLAQSAAVASLDAEDELQQRIEQIVAERDRVTVALRAAGLDVVDSQANFVWLAAGAATEALTTHFENFGLAVRAFPGEGLRISIGERNANDALLAATAELPEGARS